MAQAKNTTVIVRNVVLLDSTERTMVGTYHAIGVAYNSGKASGEWDSLRSCIAAIRTEQGMVIALARLQRGVAIADTFKTAADAQAAFDSSKFGTSLSSFLAKACGKADPNASKAKAKAKATKVSAKDKATVTALASAVANPALRKAILALVK